MLAIGKEEVSIDVFHFINRWNTNVRIIVCQLYFRRDSSNEEGYSFATSPCRPRQAPPPNMYTVDNNSQ